MKPRNRRIWKRRLQRLGVLMGLSALVLLAVFQLEVVSTLPTDGHELARQDAARVTYYPPMER